MIHWVECSMKSNGFRNVHFETTEASRRLPGTHERGAAMVHGGGGGVWAARPRRPNPTSTVFFQETVDSLGVTAGTCASEAENYSRPMSNGDFVSAIQSGYSFKGDAVLLGVVTRDGKVFPEAPVRLPLLTINRHGLISGATGTGKTKTLQMIAEQLSEAGVPTLLMDIKGDLSGLAMPGTPAPAIAERHAKIGSDWSPSAYPVEFLTLSNEPGRVSGRLCSSSDRSFSPACSVSMRRSRASPRSSTNSATTNICRCST
jgi:hypothetical protein